MPAGMKIRYLGPEEMEEIRVDRMIRRAWLEAGLPDSPEILFRATLDDGRRTYLLGRTYYGAKTEDAAGPVAGHAGDFLTTAQVAQKLGVSRRWVEARIADGSIPHYRLPPKNKLVRFQMDEVTRWLRGEA